MWSDLQIKQHIEAAKLLTEIIVSSFKYLKKGISEYELQQFILKKFKELNLKTDKDPPIVAFNENSSHPHYFPSKESKILENNSLILIDIWARLNQRKAPFADITWIAYYGEKITNEIQKTFNTVIKARDACLNYIDNELKKDKIPLGNEIDNVAQTIITSEGFKQNLKHKTGHCIGFNSPHGNRKNLDPKNNKPLILSYGYTIEPGIYFDNKFGIRSETNFYINKYKKLVISTELQREIIKI